MAERQDYFKPQVLVIDDNDLDAVAEMTDMDELASDSELNMDDGDDDDDDNDNNNDFNNGDEHKQQRVRASYPMASPEPTTAGRSRHTAAAAEFKKRTDNSNTQQQQRRAAAHTPLQPIEATSKRISSSTSSIGSNGYDAIIAPHSPTTEYAAAAANRQTAHHAPVIKSNLSTPIQHIAKSIKPLSPALSHTPQLNTPSSSGSGSGTNNTNSSSSSSGSTLKTNHTPLKQLKSNFTQLSGIKLPK